MHDSSPGVCDRINTRKKGRFCFDDCVFLRLLHQTSSHIALCNLWSSNQFSRPPRRQEAITQEFTDSVAITIFTDLSLVDVIVNCFSCDIENDTSFVFLRVVVVSRDVLGDCTCDVSNDCPLI